MNSRVGRRTNNKVIDLYGNQNDNGERLIQVCQNHLLKITNGFYRHKDIHTFTWVQHMKNLKSVIDHVIVKQNTRLQINDVRPIKKATCGSDQNKNIVSLNPRKKEE